MQVNFGNNTIVERSQFGDKNTMIMETDSANMPDEYWRELNTILFSLLNQKDVSDEKRVIVHDALNCVERKDKKGLIAFFKNNKSGFVTNMLSNFASTGLLSFLNSLCR